jgi:DNA-binding beta-propeller fold protein YncE
MRSRAAIAVLLAVTGACAGPQTATRVRRLSDEGEVTVYLLPRSSEVARISFSVASVALRREDREAGADIVPLEVVQAAVDGGAPSREWLVARGRVPPGRYAGVLVQTGDASVARDGSRARLLVPEEPARADLHLTVASGAAQVLFLVLKHAEAAARDDYRFAPAFTATLAPQTPPQIALYCTDEARASVTVVDRRARLTTGAVPTGDVPRGIALDRTATRAYVALEGEDVVQVVDVAANVGADRFRLAPGDGPRDLAITGDGSTLVVLNERSRTVAFLDLPGGNELARVAVGDGPVMLLLERTGRRAFVVNRASASVTVVDAVARTVVTTLATDPEPIWAQLSRDGSRLYVVHRGSAYLGVFAVPSLAPQTRAYVGLGAGTLRVDPRTDLLYLARADEGRIDVYDPVSLQPIDRFALPEAASRLAIDDVENTLLALMPHGRAIAVVDLTNRRVLSELPVGDEPYGFAFSGERF